MTLYNILKRLVIQVFVIKDYCKQWLIYILNRNVRKNLNNIDVLNVDESIDYIIKNKCSLSRYGDGEFLMVWQYITGEKFMNDLYFQKYDPDLGRRLTEILKDNDYMNSKHAVGISYSYYKGVNGMTFDTRRFLYYYINKHHKLMLSSINTDRQYLNSELSRFYITRKNKKLSRKIVGLLSKIWYGRNICFIEGEQSRLGVGNDLFNNANSIHRILCPSENAFRKYDEILNAAIQMPKDTLFIIALGMAATVLAYDLSKHGYQALDLGHIDIEYEWMLMGVKHKVPVPHKYTNEVNGGKNPDAISDLCYNSQIKYRIGC